MSENITLTRSEGEALIVRALQNSNVGADQAASVARALVAAEIDGQGGHGFSRVSSYAAQARVGKVDGHATPVLTRRGTGFLQIDARHGFAYPAFDMAIEELSRLTPEAGIAGAAIHNSHHAGQIGAHAERLAEQGFAALMVANAPKAMAPWGGNAALLGTNPIAFAAPRADGPPLVIDLSLSEVARGKVMAAQKAGKPIPEGWALDADGNPTTDPDAAMKGTMLPAGGAKGAALALMVEVLTATLTGGQHSKDASSLFDTEGEPPSLGQLIIAFDVTGAPGGRFASRIEEILSAMTAQGARLPGTRRLDGRARTEAEGLTVPEHLLAEIRALAGDS
ncbi:Ldh family oxidoreductase [Palleronia caenipelagi]|uniref:Ldh family oxidoreductase n=1 Tax=Palleronia caenipelagi TaxID=2489174 RepID=A0A547Q025_9RHOB|nr:Ldh family oxidoreductase [Palleronia caenipelagi]TRD19750.1 Ldh family oxidoreductase [Palleronia caenipelagi]